MRYLAGVSTLELSPGICTGCGLCATVCPHGVMVMDNGRARILDRDACMECGACARNCPPGAVTVQAGVGCAQAVINSALGRTGSSCCSLEAYAPGREEDSPEDCGCPAPPGPGSGCC